MLENKVAIITDSGSSIRQESTLAKEYQVTSVPLDIKFFENGNWISYEDTSISADEFYAKMSQSKQLPQTSGAITGRLKTQYEAFAKDNRPVISIHITARHSAVWGSAVLGSDYAKEKYPHLLIGVVDSKQVSIGTWFLVELAAKLANEGYPLADINQLVLETIPKINLSASLSTFENAVKGGRLSPLAGFVGTNLHLRPTVAIVDGELLKQNLSSIYSGNIGIYEAGPVLGVHAGEKCLAVVTQTA